MKAWVLYGVNEIRYEDLPRPVPGAGEVLIEVAAAGICGSDLPRIFETGAHRVPLIPGHEFSGTVIETGPGMGAAWIQKRVGVYPLIPCGKCAPCQEMRPELCRDYDYLGSRRDGGFAEYAVVPEKSLVELPESVPFEVAAMLEPLAVAVHAIRRSRIQKQEKALVIGMGTIGLLTVMLLQSRNIREIYAVANKESQRSLAREAGALPYQGGIRPDVVFECVGKEETIRQAVNLAAPGGRVVLAGNPGTDVCFPRDLYWKILRNQLTLTGTWNSTFVSEEEDDWHFALRMLADGKLNPEKLITHRFPLSRLSEALTIMREKKEPYTKVMITDGETRC